MKETVMAKKTAAKPAVKTAKEGMAQKSSVKPVDKYRNLTENELHTTTRDLQDQLFRLRFQMKMGQTESLNKLRQLRKDVARVKTIARSRSLGLEAAAGAKR